MNDARTTTVTGFHVVRSVTEFDASAGQHSVYFDILATSTSKSRMVETMRKEIKRLEDYPAIRECVVTPTGEDSFTVVTNDCPGNKLSEVIMHFEIITLPIEIELHHSAANDIMWANQNVFYEADIREVVDETYPDWGENLSIEEITEMEMFIKNSTARYMKYMLNDGTWRANMEDAIKEEINHPEYSAVSKMLQEIADKM